MTNKPMAEWLTGMEGRSWRLQDTGRVFRHIREVEAAWAKLAQHQLAEQGRDAKPDAGPRLCAAPGMAATAPEDSACPCWATGSYVWVDGCRFHPRESVT